MRGLTERLRRIPIRLKLTLAFAGVMAVVLAALGLFMYLRFESGLDASLDQQLRARASEIAGLVPTTDLGRRLLRERSENFAQILDADGHVVDASAGLGTPLLSDSEIQSARRGAILVERHERTRLYALPIDHGQQIVVVGVSLAEHERAIETLGAALLIGGPLALLVASLAGYLLAAAALQPVESMRRRAASISTGDLHARLPLPDTVDEVHRLGVTLNEMLARLEQGLERERAFVADASHELRSPLAVLKGELEIALMNLHDTDELRIAVTSAVEETDRIIALAEELLVLARVEADSPSLLTRELSAAGLLDTVRQTYAPLAERAGRTLSTRTDNGARLHADPERLRQALGNIIENALHYGRGPISIHAQQIGEQVEIHVTDDGPGFPKDFLPHAFERFSRADPARARGGTGLGLAIVQAIARAHGGHAHATNRTNGGADVWLELPTSTLHPAQDQPASPLSPFTQSNRGEEGVNAAPRCS